MQLLADPGWDKGRQPVRALDIPPRGLGRFHAVTGRCGEGGLRGSLSDIGAGWQRGVEEGEMEEGWEGPGKGVDKLTSLLRVRPPGARMGDARGKRALLGGVENAMLPAGREYLPSGEGEIPNDCRR